MLGPLSAADAGGLVDHLLGGAGLDEQTRLRVVQAADGNPLFVEQMVSMLVDKELLRRVDGRWEPTADMSSIAVPPTIQALLASRLDDLSREERSVVEPAAVIGIVFPQPAVEEMVPQQVRTAVPGHLGTLDDKQFVYPRCDRPGRGDLSLSSWTDPRRHLRQPAQAQPCPAP